MNTFAARGIGRSPTSSIGFQEWEAIISLANLMPAATLLPGPFRHCIAIGPRLTSGALEPPDRHQARHFHSKIRCSVACRTNLPGPVD
jgi:hypothetical protein